MACDYLTVLGEFSLSCHSSFCIGDLNFLATLVAVERVFSKGQLIISHIQNRLSGQSTWALMCLGAWTKQQLVKSSDLVDALKLPDVEDDDEVIVDDYAII
jgi:hypothetical protein